MSGQRTYFINQALIVIRISTCVRPIGDLITNHDSTSHVLTVGSQQCEYVDVENARPRRERTTVFTLREKPREECTRINRTRPRRQGTGQNRDVERKLIEHRIVISKPNRRGGRRRKLAHSSTVQPHRTGSFTSHLGAPEW